VTPTVTEWPGIGRWRPRADNDLVHVQFAPSAYGYSGGIGLLPLTTRRPVVTTLHEYGWWSWTPLERPARLADAERALSRAAERTGRWDRETLLLAPASRELIVTGGGHARMVRSRLGRSADVIPIGANVGLAFPGDRAAARKALGWPGEAPVVAFFGFVHPVKGLRYLIEAVQALRKTTQPELRLAVVGGWRSLAWPDDEADAFVAELRQHARDVGLPEEALAFSGFADERTASTWLRAADAAALPFTAGVTAKSGSLLTCWAHELPVLATEPPGGADPDVDGAVLAAAIRDAETLRTGLAQLLADQRIRRGLVDAGCARMAARSWPAVAGAHAELYRRVAAGSGPA
jgi:glycosyltransferase involved in cell wall biosynthesis